MLSCVVHVHDTNIQGPGVRGSLSKSIVLLITLVQPLSLSLDAVSIYDGLFKRRCRCTERR